jgi:hypothetical protein
VVAWSRHRIKCLSTRVHVLLMNRTVSSDSRVLITLFLPSVPPYPPTAHPKSPVSDNLNNKKKKSNIEYRDITSLGLPSHYQHNTTPAVGVLSISEDEIKATVASVSLVASTIRGAPVGPALTHSRLAVTTPLPGTFQEPSGALPGLGDREDDRARGERERIVSILSHDEQRLIRELRQKLNRHCRCRGCCVADRGDTSVGTIIAGNGDLSDAPQRGF